MGDPQVDIIERAVLAYQSCASYVDNGIVRTAAVHDASRTEIRQDVLFQTAFVRPERFRFEFSKRVSAQETYRRVICMNGERIRTWWDLDDTLPAPESLQKALSGAGGVSRYSSFMIPRLLMPDILSGRTIRDLTDREELQDDTSNRSRVRSIRGLYGETPMTVCVDTASFLVRRITIEIAGRGTSAEHAIEYTPVMNCAVPNVVFET